MVPKDEECENMNMLQRFGMSLAIPQIIVMRESTFPID